VSTLLTSPRDTLPVGELIALAMAGFLAIITETMPAGLMPMIASDLDISNAMTGQMVTIYAFGSTIAALPLTALTQGFRRKPLLLLGIIGFLAMNTITAITHHFGLILSARFLAGLCAGLVWGLQAGYAKRLVTSRLQGRALAIAMAGAPLAFSIGTPTGVAVGNLIGWREAFLFISGVAFLLALWVAHRLPDLAGQYADKRLSPLRVLKIPGIITVLSLTMAWVGAHNILYTYVAPFTAMSGLQTHVSALLLLFGVSSLAGVWLAGVLTEKPLKTVILLALSTFLLMTVAVSLFTQHPYVIVAMMVLWGLSYGGAGTLIQLASASVAGEGIDLASAMISTVWNSAITLAGLLGGMALTHGGPKAISLSMIPIICAGIMIVLRARTGAFAPRRVEAR